jgi:dihydroxyacetone kinase
MMTAAKLAGALRSVSSLVQSQAEYLTRLDQQSGDGDLGVSMRNGFQAAAEYASASDEADVGLLLMRCASAMNESAPSTLGTILSFFMMGAAKKLRGSINVSLQEIVEAMEAGVALIMSRAQSKPGEKTVLDALCPAIDALGQCRACGDFVYAFREAAQAAGRGALSTKNMPSVHGRAAYYPDQCLGKLDGGAVVGKLIFEGIYAYCQGNGAPVTEATEA